MPLPVNIETVDMLTSSSVRSVEDMARWLNATQLQLEGDPADGEEAAKQRVGEQLFKKLFAEYTQKQWAMPVLDLSVSTSFTLHSAAP